MTIEQLNRANFLKGIIDNLKNDLKILNEINDPLSLEAKTHNGERFLIGCHLTEDQFFTLKDTVVEEIERELKDTEKELSIL